MSLENPISSKKFIFEVSVNLDGTFTFTKIFKTHLFERRFSLKKLHICLYGLMVLWNKNFETLCNFCELFPPFPWGLFQAFTLNTHNGLLICFHLHNTKVNLCSLICLLLFFFFFLFFFFYILSMFFVFFIWVYYIIIVVDN